MSREASKKLRLIYRLVNDVCQAGHDPKVWTTLLMRGLSETLDARVIGLSTGAIPRSPAEQYRAQVQLHYGFTPEQERIWVEYYCGPDCTFRSEFLRRMHSLRGRFITVRRQDVMSDAEWFALPEVQTTCRQCDICEVLTSTFFALKWGRLFGIGLHRGWGARPFTVEERRELRLLHLELARAWRNRIAAPAERDPSIERLPDRLRQVLWLLCIGKSEKEIAKQLELSPFTVHNHVKRLHQELSVNSRGELLAKALAVGGTPPVTIPGSEMNQFRPGPWAIPQENAV